MGVQAESNFPNSRLTAALQAYNVDNVNQLLFIQGQSVGGKNCLMVQIAQSSNNPLVTETNFNQYQGMSDFNISNAFVPEAYDDVHVAQGETPTTDAFRFYKGVAFKARIVVTYSDSARNSVIRVQRLNTEN